MPIPERPAQPAALAPRASAPAPARAACPCERRIAATAPLAAEAILGDAQESLDRPREHAANPRAATRRRLWDLLPRHHCVLLGAAFDARELRRMFRRAGSTEWETASDYELHASAVHYARNRNALSKLAQRQLEQRFAGAVARLRAARSASALIELWRTCSAQGEAVAAYWAALTHPECDAECDELLWREMHMTSHAEFSARREALRELRALRDLAARLGADQEQLRRRLKEERAENARLSDALRAAQRDLREASAELAQWRSGDAARAAQSRQAALERALEAARAEAEVARRALCTAVRRAERTASSGRFDRRAPGCAHRLVESTVAPPGEAIPRPDLEGLRILCLGGKPALVPEYRSVIEAVRGEFAYHDGGIEHHLGRLPAMLAAADAVLCLAGHCSHAACRLARRYCRAKGKVCVTLGSSGVGALSRCIMERFARARPATRPIGSRL